MGSISSYSSPKTSSISSFSSPKSSSYESSKVSTPSVSPKSSSYESSKVSIPAVEHRVVSRDFSNDIPKESTKINLNDFRDLLTSYLEITEQIELATINLEKLQEKKRVLEEKIANRPEYEKFANLLDSMKGLRK